MVMPQSWKSGHDIGSAAVGKGWELTSAFVAPRRFGYHSRLA
jgi:hypothetical protein